MKTILETLLEREIEALLSTAADDSNADYLAGQLVALRWALAKVRRRQRARATQASRNFRQLAQGSTPVLG